MLPQIEKNKCHMRQVVLVSKRDGMVVCFEILYNFQNSCYGLIIVKIFIFWRGTASGIIWEN